MAPIAQQIADMVDMLDAKMYSLNERILEVSREQNRQA